MAIIIDNGNAPDPDIGGVRNPNNNDTFEPGDDNGENQVQMDQTGPIQK